MCSVQEEGVTAPESRPKIIERKCMKCTEPAVVVIRGSDPLCKPCFVGYCTHKFRAAFGKSRVIRDGEGALVAFSGGLNSSAMLHLIQEGKSPRANRKLRFQPSLVYIDEGSTLDMTDAERQDYTQRVIDLMVKSGLPWCMYKLEQVMDPSFCSSEPQPADQPSMSDLEEQMAGVQVDNALWEKLTRLLGAAKTLTAKENLIQTLRTQLLVAAASRRGFSKLLLGDSSTRLAVRMLSDITQGRGAHVALQMSFADCRHGDVTVVRPMREFVAKEIAMLLSLNGVESTVLPTVATMTPGQASLDRLTEGFVAGLQAVHPRTVPTVFRTGEKMDINLEESTNLPRCVLCKAPLDTDVGQSSALSATLFSQSLSNSRRSCTQKAEAEGACCGEGDGSCKSQQTSLSRQELQDALCYGCRLVAKDMGDVAALPEVVLDAAGRAARRNQMKEAIQDFLLEDDGQ